MSMKDTITIVIATDNHYVILVAALLKSIEANHKTGEKLDFYIIDDGISSVNRKRLLATINPATTSIQWRKTSEVVPPEVKIPVDYSAFPITTYLRLFSPYIVPADAERMIYLDADTIVTEDISKLWHTNIGDKLFGAVIDVGEVVSVEWGGIPNYKQLGIPPETKYFNAGLMLIDTKKWRDADITNKVMKALHDNIKFVNYADQYGLNVVLYNQWHELDRRWNTFAFKEVKDPYMIHYLDIKPIFKTYKSNPVYKDEFYKYLRQTPWKKHTPVSDYRRLARKAYNRLKKKAFNLFKR